jgi:hypothetical protein
MKYQEKLRELKVDETQLTTVLKDGITDIIDALDALNHAKKDILELDDEESIEELENEIKSLENTIDDLDENLVGKIDKWYVKRIRFKENMEKGKNAVIETNIAPTPTQAQAQPEAPIQQQAQPKEVPYVEATEMPKQKKTNWALLLVAGIIAVVTINQVMIKVDD